VYIWRNCEHIHKIIISGSTVLVRTLAASHRRFRNLIRTCVRTPLDKWSARRKGLYLHGIRTHGPNNQAAKTYALGRATTGTGTYTQNNPKTWVIRRVQHDWLSENYGNFRVQTRFKMQAKAEVVTTVCMHPPARPCCLTGVQLTWDLVELVLKFNYGWGCCQGYTCCYSLPGFMPRNCYWDVGRNTLPAKSLISQRINPVDPNTFCYALVFKKNRSFIHVH
jgi:hypothetical protein